MCSKNVNIFKRYFIATKCPSPNAVYIVVGEKPLSYATVYRFSNS